MCIVTTGYLLPLVLALFLILTDILVYRHQDEIHITGHDLFFIFCPVVNWLLPVIGTWMVIEIVFTKMVAARASRRSSSFE